MYLFFRFSTIMELVLAHISGGPSKIEKRATKLMGRVAIIQNG